MNGNRNIRILKPGQTLTAGGAQHPTASDLERTEFLDPVTIALSHARLQTLLPPGWRGTLPAEPAEGDPDRWRPDYSLFIDRVLQLHAGCVNWLDAWIVDLNARGNFGDPGRVALLFETLEQLLQAGANPWAMRHLIELASWEARLASEMGVFRQRCAAPSSPGRMLMTPNECAAWIRCRQRAMGSIFADQARMPRATSGFETLNPRGVLGCLGYEVGAAARSKGLHTSHRRDNLRDALCIDLSGLKNREAIAWWGPAGSEARANAIIRCIEFFLRLAAARTSGDWGRAIQDWEADLGWMRKELLRA